MSCWAGRHHQSPMNTWVFHLFLYSILISLFQHCQPYLKEMKGKKVKKDSPWQTQPWLFASSFAGNVWNPYPDGIHKSSISQRIRKQKKKVLYLKIPPMLISTKIEYIHRIFFFFFSLCFFFLLNIFDSKTMVHGGVF